MSRDGSSARGMTVCRMSCFFRKSSGRLMLSVVVLTAVAVVVLAAVAAGILAAVAAVVLAVVLVVVLVRVSAGILAVSAVVHIVVIVSHVSYLLKFIRLDLLQE